MPSSAPLASDLLDSPVAGTLSRLFEHLPDICFFVKDRESRFLHANRALLERLGFARVSEITATRDHDRYPPHVAEALVEGDRSVMESGTPLIDHAEVLFDHSGRLEWFSTTKYPILGRDGAALGIAGFTRSLSSREHHSSGTHAAAKAVDWISRQPDTPLRVAGLARKFGISERQLHRQFLQLVGMTPREFLLRSRIQAAAADLRQTGETIASLAHRYGFCDQSAFTRQFRKVLGTTPASYRSSSFRDASPGGGDTRNS